MTHNPDRPDRFTRESFTFRRMRPWQTWSLAIVALVLVAIALLSFG